ncbi:actin binding protein [Scheffersomyces stipitis CBS 6054]|uniref:Actin binding protein n=1 Tax=Scheffersomyces stipitis (strain ATCC 58785 / CBS 6054 / NBRC 10063 / NRRL Y-11545) TaxID=322104 RepID=A3GGK5_PICST|nr:actin binding protein [Scheffersomyces stipitis CBS 6054]EAZ63948.2 actin binding protein [Scheffersomyces stipitis CBS 6054]
MEKIDLSSNSRKIQDAYDKLVRGDPSVNYVVYSVDASSTLEVSQTGNGSLEEFVENFSDGRIQFGLARVTVPGSDVSKNILLGWCPDNAPSKSRLSFASNFAEVSKVLSGYHVQITARDQDDLDIDDFVQRVRAAAGASYSLNTGTVKAAAAPVPKPVVVKPIVAKPSKPASVSGTSFIPKSTGKPVAPVKPKPPKPVASSNDGWGDAQDVEERDLDSKPLEDVPSAYKPTKVNISELRSQKSDTISSTPKPFKAEPKPAEKDDDNEPKSLSDRMKTYKSFEPSSDGRLTSLPKPKVSHSVNTRYKSEAPSFGAKPTFGQSDDSRKDKVVGGLSRNFAAENGKTPAQIWAEKRGQYKTVEAGESESGEVHAHSSDLAHKFEEQEEEEKPTPSLPVRSLPPPPARVVEPEPEAEEEKEEEAPAASLPSRSLPARNLPPPPAPAAEPEEEEEEEAPAPSLPSREAEPKKDGASAVAEYDYVKDEDNEIGFAEGDLIVEIEFTDEEWWTGKHSKSGEVGLFPAAYVSLKKEEEKATEPETKAEPVVEKKSEGRSATAEYDYEKDEDNEIGFAEGDVIVEIEFIDDDWWSGKHSKSGEVGLFPANYVSLI